MIFYLLSLLPVLGTILQEPEIKYEEDEFEICRVKRHWMILIFRTFVPMLVLLTSLGLMLFRLGGGDVLGTGGAAGRFDTVSLLVVVVIIGLIIAHQLLLRRQPKKRARRWALIGVIVLLLIYLYFHLSGGRLFTQYGGSNGFDTFNVWLLWLAIGSYLIVDYLFYDWSNDDLILTNRRILYEEYTPLFRDFRLQTQIENIQSVTAKIETFFQNWFGHGTLIIQSAGQTRLIFNGAGRFYPMAFGPVDSSKPPDKEKLKPDNPSLQYLGKTQGYVSDDFKPTTEAKTRIRKRVSRMQQEIQGKLDDLKKQRNPLELRELVEKQVYGKSGPVAAPTVALPRSNAGLGWLIPPNPEIIGDQQGTIIWRKIWLFELLYLIPPIGLLVLLIFALITEYNLDLFDTSTTVVGALVAFLVIAVWIWYVVTDYRNDLYILSTSTIVDVDKTPLGREDRRQANLGQIQNVNYETTIIGNLLSAVGLGYGDVFVETASNVGRFTFHNVPNPRNVATTINDYLDAYRRGERERNLRESLQLLAEYHNAQRDHNELR